MKKYNSTEFINMVNEGQHVEVSMLRIVSLFFILSLNTLIADECTGQWIQNLSINPSTPKAMSGDTYAGYALLSWYDQPNLKLVMKGKFFKGRFMSFESYVSKQKLHHDALFDYQMVADAGSENPFREGTRLDTPNRNYTVEVVPNGFPTAQKNVLYVSRFARIHSIFYRAYVPNTGVKLSAEDLPRIYAYNLRTGRPARCPVALNTVFDPGNLVEAFVNLVSKDNTITFKESSFWNGTNFAIPKYVVSISKMRENTVSLIRFKAPTSTQTGSGIGVFKDNGEVRYWSLCSQNIVESKTLTCLPDYLARIDSQGFVNVVVGRGQAVADAAYSRGYSFLEDRRLPEQEVQALFYRNLLAKPGFPAYKGEYLPVGVVCDEAQFLNGSCF